MTNLKTKYNILQASNTALKQENIKHKEEIDKLTEAINDQNDTISIYNEKISQLQNNKNDIDDNISYQTQIEKLQNENDALTDKLIQAENLQESLNKQLTELQSKIKKEGNDEDEKEHKSLADTQRQMEIFWSESCRAKSLLLCSSKVEINDIDFSFGKWLETNLNERATKTLWSKLNTDTCNAAVFISLLATTTMIYKTKCHQARTNSNNRPNIDIQKIKRYVEHLCVWIIRHYGIQTNDKRFVKVKMDNGEIREEEVDKWKLSLTHDDFSNNIADWVQAYVKDQGMIESVI